MNDARSGEHLEALRQQTALARFGELVLRSDDLDDILTEACRLVRDALGTDLAKVMELQPGGEILLARAGVGWNSGIVGNVTIEVSKDTSEAYALKTGHPVVSADIAKETRFRYPAFLTDHGVQAIANVIIVGGKERPPFGILQIDSRQPRPFNESDLVFLRNYANLLAAAVDRMRTLDDVRSERERLRMALDAGDLGSWKFDPSTGVMMCSARHDVIFGYSDATVSWTIDSLLAHVEPEDRERVAAAWRCNGLSGTEMRCEFRIHRAGDNERRWIEARGRSVEGVGSASHMVGIVADVTARKAKDAALLQSNDLLEAEVASRTQALSEANERLRAEAAERESVEEALRQSQKMEAVGQLTGGIAHDFNNMLHAIGGSLELMSRRLGQGRTEEVAALMTNARTTVRRAASLTNRLLAFARQHTFQAHVIEPGALMHGMIDLIQRTVGPAIMVEEKMSSGAWTVLCDPYQLESALLNIAINARDAMPTGGTLAISTREVQLSPLDVVGQENAKPGDYVEIAIADSGVGMDEATRARAFEPFFTTKPIGKGTGLGLSQIYGFIRQSNGVVLLESVPGQGTAVRLCLPRHQSRRQDQAHPATSVSPANAVVLLVDDETTLPALVPERLRELGHQVLEATDGEAALGMLGRGHDPPVDLLAIEAGLSDDPDGWRIASAARAIRPELPVLFITAGTAGFPHTLASGMSVIGKPFTLDVLAARINSMVNQAPDAGFH